MKDKGSTVRTSIDLPLEPAAVFDAIAEELSLALTRLGIHFEAGSEGRVTQGSFEVGRIVAWEPGKRIAIEWRQASWEPDEMTEIEFLFKAIDGGTQLRLEHPSWGRLIGESDEVVGWFASEIAAPFLRAMAPEALGGWITDRKTRRPSGTQSRAFYRDPLYHGLAPFQWTVSRLSFSTRDSRRCGNCGSRVAASKRLWESRSDFHGLVSFHNS